MNMQLAGRQLRFASTTFAKSKTNKKVADVVKTMDTNERTKLIRNLRGLKPQVWELTEEEKAYNNKVGFEYNRQSTIEHNVLQMDLYLKIQMKWLSIAALPDDLLEEALEDDTALFPLDRVVPTWTPPIPTLAENRDSDFRSKKIHLREIGRL